MPITVIVALQITSAENTAELLGSSTFAEAEGKLWKRVEVDGVPLTAETAEKARTQAFGRMATVMVSHSWGDAFFVPGRDEPGSTRKKWSAERTRKLFGNSREEV